MRYSMRRAADANRHAARVFLRLRRQLLDLLGKGCRKQHRLALGRHLLEDALHRGQKAHIQHAIGLIQHQDFDLIEIGVALVDQIEQPPRASHQDIDPIAQRPDLRAGVYASIDGSAAQARPGAKLADRIVNLLCQFAGGGDNQRAYAAALAVEQFL